MDMKPPHRSTDPHDKGQVVLVLQGGGALGAYQAGVYEALHEAGVEPDWVIGTSIGAINGALIAGNDPPNRMTRLREFWRRVEQGAPFAVASIFLRGIAPFFTPRALGFGGVYAQVGLDAASYYSTEPLRATLGELVSLECLNAKRMRLTVGAVNVRTSAMRYFDSRDAALALDHIMASGALPPAFPAVRIDGEPYWDGGVYSNTPIEAVLDDKPRRDSVIFGVNVWQPSGPEPQSIWQVLGRQKDIQYASRADSHIARQKQIHHLRHVISQLAELLPPDVRDSMQCKELASWGCRTTMHVVRLLAPTLDSEDYLKDIDFTPSGIRARWQAGLADTRRMIERAPWNMDVDPMEGVVVHELSARTGMEVKEMV
jgi:NTE family protein